MLFRFRDLFSHAGLVACVCLSVAGPAGDASAQGYDSWSKVEAAEETREYGQQIRDGAFDAPQQAVLERIILPQLALEANRATIVQVRQRIRDILTRGTTVPKVFDAANTTARDFLIRVVRDDKRELIVRVNAMILIGELVAADRKPWAGSIEPLAKAASDATLPLAIRIAAMNGLAHQVAEGRGTDPAFVKSVGPAVASILTSPPEGDRTAVAWLVRRALDLAAVSGGSPANTAAAAGILADEKADFDLRIRAAATLGRLVQAKEATNLSAAAGQIRSLAMTAIDRELSAAEARRFSRQLGHLGKDHASMLQPGGGMPPPQAPLPATGGGMAAGEGLFGGAGGGAAAAGNPAGVPSVVDPDAVPVLACRRDAWRLMTLADAIKPEPPATGGIAAALTGDAAAEALELATILRREGKAINATHDEVALKNALAALQAFAKSAKPDPSTAPPTGTPTGPAAKDPTTGPAPASPFDASGDSSPPF
jgi:hypothetical protein